MSGQPFTLRKLVEPHLITQTAALSHAELTQPSCPACYRPGHEQGYCARCESSGAAERHRAPRRIRIAAAPSPPAPVKRHDKRNRVAPETLLTALRTYAAEHGTVPTRGAWERAHQLPSYASAYRLYGSWGAALQAAGLEQPR